MYRPPTFNLSWLIFYSKADLCYTRRLSRHFFYGKKMKKKMDIYLDSAWNVSSEISPCTNLYCSKIVTQLLIYVPTFMIYLIFFYDWNYWLCLTIFSLYFFSISSTTFALTYLLVLLLDNFRPNNVAMVFFFLVRMIKFLNNNIYQFISCWW